MKLASLFVVTVIGQELDLAEDITEESALAALSEAFEIDVTAELIDSEQITRRRGGQDTRSYGKVKVLQKYYNHQAGNSDFETKKLKLYGCHCGGGTKGDFDYTSGGSGVPVDRIDSVCRDYANCLKCIDEAYDNKCARDTRYRLVFQNGLPLCKNDVGSCQRSVCECDHQFAINMAGVFEDYSGANWFRGGFDRDLQCFKKDKRSAGEGFEVKPVGCCGTKETFPLNRIYRSDQCCVEQTATIKDIGTC
ncbi:Oidioi.mRNA.OKI2018_I69.XSR.g16063.t1.cds [Oikopleura dioica]|uniref:Oidioi.mRNA.OKI2018_I69.XSR.g16063.t1.cds n=1 Tax=Oikopleura dioica TaxID=34765 RepID=A0ABN7SIW8_OIKDI|nr:Oidioi.mRNA.OKI2018_I69.XSR.g16063.t1.cds [Oikopleura dioica]